MVTISNRTTVDLNRNRTGHDDGQWGEKREQNTSHGQFCHLCSAWRGCLGLEPTPALYVAHMVEVFREVWRVLRDDGTVWLNLGSSYASNGGSRDYGSHDGGTGRGPGVAGNRTAPHSFKPKDLIPIPWMVAMALQQDGWYLRSSIIWAKGLSFCPTYSGSVMPESCRDRPTSAYEHVFLLSKQRRYYYDNEAVRENFADERMGNPGAYKWSYANDPETGKGVRGNGGPSIKMQTEGWNASGGKSGRNLRNVFAIPDPRDSWALFTDWLTKRLCDEDQGRYEALIREYLDAQENVNDVFVVNPASFKGSHFATFAPALVEPCIKAGTSERGCCPECGGPWERVVRKEKPPASVYTETIKPDSIAPVSHPELKKAGMGQKLQDWYNEHPSHTLGWRPSCSCYDWRYWDDFPQAKSARKRHQRSVSGDWFRRVRKRAGLDSWPVVPAVCLDPFGGAGTTALVARQLGRDAILVELSADYVKMARRRLDGTQQVETTDHNGDTVTMEQGTMFSSVAVE